MTRLLILLIAFMCGFTSTGVQAASLTVSPIRLDVVHPGNNTRVVLRNDGPRPITAQVRVFKWSAMNGQDHFSETRDIVVSPPIASLPPGTDFNVRILRAGGGPVQGEESYRVVIDEIPEANRVRTIGITIAIRYAVPLFILSPDATKPQVSWSVRMVGGRRVLAASNAGDVHLRLANVSVGNVKLAKGLLGYVLGKSTRYFVLPRNANPSGAVTADTDQGRLNATLGR